MNEQKGCNFGPPSPTFLSRDRSLMSHDSLTGKSVDNTLARLLLFKFLFVNVAYVTDYFSILYDIVQQEKFKHLNQMNIVDFYNGSLCLL